MIKLLVLILTIELFCCRINCFGQIPTTKEEGEALARRVMLMTPAQMMKFRDSMMNAVKQQQAKALPNGNQILTEHHYDTSYTTVSFSYTRKISQNKTHGTSGSTQYTVYGTSAKAPMMYEANGHTIVQCSMSPPGANTSAIDETAKKINESKKYMTPGQAQSSTDAARQMAFASMTINDNSLAGGASENGGYSGYGGTTTITTRPPIIRMAFSFIYDPEMVLSTIAVGATINVHSESRDDKGNSGHSDNTEDIGMSGATDPQKAKVVGGTKPEKDPDAAYIKVTKTAYGFQIQYQKNKHLKDESNTDISETLVANIGAPLQQYEAVLHPMPDSKYERWLPKGPKVDGSDDTKGDDSARFYVEVHDKNNPNKLYPGSYTVKYQLKDVTHYKGITSNYPVFVGHADPDFKISDSIKYFSPATFDAASVTDSTATSQPNKGNLAILRLMCLDYGAWAKLTAEVTLDDGSVITASPYYDKGETFITVPFDRDENKIADIWEKHENIFGRGYGLDWDADVKPDNSHPGDNIPLIDEYRGFLTEDDNYKPIYKRFSPQVKELITIGLADMSGPGEQYKGPIRIGSQGYGKVSGVKVYHLTNSKYGQHEPGEPGVVSYGRWVNFNSPSSTYTRGVTIYASDQPNPDPDQDVQLAYGTTSPLFAMDAAHNNFNGAMLPEETRGITIWLYNINHHAYEPSEYLPAALKLTPDVIRKNSYITRANAEFHVNIDTLTVSKLVAQYFYVNIARVISFTTAHELCHATHIHHHHFNEKDGFFKGATTCPVRYWMNNYIAQNASTWVAMYITGLWNPGALTTPWGAGDQMKLCTVGDNCFAQLQLKKN